MSRIVEETEARLLPPRGRGRGRGRCEWERYGDGSEALCARFRKLDLPEGASVSVRLDGIVVGDAVLVEGAGRLAFESCRGERVPKAASGQVCEVVHAEIVLLRGVFASA
jgi:hypothetical protein